MMMYVLLIAISIGIFAVVLQPLLEARRRYTPPPQNTLNDLRARRTYLLEALRDVELDYATGKAEESHYEETRRTYLREAAEVQRQLDQMRDRLDSDIEREIAELREAARQQSLEQERPTEAT
jgi:type II secretory pathway component PulM